MPENNNRYISTKLFTPLYILIFTVIIAIATIFNITMARQDDKISVNEKEISAVQGDIKAINQNLSSISSSILEIKDSLKKR